VIEALRDDPALPATEILRAAPAAEAGTELERLALSGDRAAAFLLQSRDRVADRNAARRVLEDPSEPAWRRRLAAWRWPGAPAELVQAALAPVTEPGGEVFAAVLLAERCLPPAEAADRAEAWIRSFDDDEKRAGALLAALLGVHRELLTDAHEAEDVPAVRTIQRLALGALGTTGGPADFSELVHRTLHRGGLDPDVALCALAAGDPLPLEALAALPDTADLRAAVHARAWLIERFVPAWHDRAGRPLGGDVAGLRLHFEGLNGLRVLTARRLAFDRDGKRFVIRE
jgi:hypothetical protein